MSSTNERGSRTWSLWRAIAIVILAFGLYATVVRYAKGLGASTNLSDAFPWGLWIGFDMLVGVGLAAGGFLIAATVHVFRMEKYEPIARPAVLTAFLGYLLVIVALLYDLGLPWRIWHPIIMWNPHSVMFEVGWCVMLYTTVLALEFSPLVFEKLGLEKPRRIIHAVFIPLVIVGVLLSTLHQSSLGTLYVIAPDKLHGLWYTPLLPVFFFITAIAGGLAMTIFESFMSFRAFGKRLEPELLQGLGRAIVVVLGVYAVFKFQDLLARGNLGLVFRLTPESVLFWGEAGLGVLLPLVLFAIPRVRRNESGLFLAATLTILGFIVNRLNVAVTGMAGSAGTTYIPSWMELAVTMSLVVAGFILFSLAVKYLPVFPGETLPGLGKGGSRMIPIRHPIFNRAVLLSLWGLLLVGLVATAAGKELGTDGDGPPSPPGEMRAVASADDLSLPGPRVFPAGDDSPGPVTFDHASHVDPDAPDCGPCHRTLFSINEPCRPVRGEVSFERVHEGDLCASCHDGQRAFGVEDDCSACHGI